MKETRPFLAGISLAFILASWLFFQAFLAWEVRPAGYGMIALAFGVVAGLGVLGGPLLLFWGGYMIWKRGRLPGCVHALIFLFGAGTITVLTVPGLTEHAKYLIPAVVVLSFALSPLIARVIAPRMRLRNWGKDGWQRGDMISG